jgi:sugar lactone lactonase YvrE
LSSASWDIGAEAGIQDRQLMRYKERMRSTIGLLLALCVCPIALADLTLIAGGGSGGDGSPAAQAALDKPFGVDQAPDGTLYIIDFAGRLRAITPDGKLTTVCGGGEKGDTGDGGPASQARLNTPHALAVGPGGDVYIADTLNHRIRRIDAKTRLITTFAGTTKGFSGDGGPAVKAQFSGIYCIAFNLDKSKLVITDLDNRRIRVIDMASDIVTTIAGNGAKGVPKDGEPAADQPLVDPRAAAMDSKGNVYVLERGGHALRVVDPSGKIHTLIAGPASPKAPHELAGPKHLAIDRRDDVLIADTDNHRIVKWLVAERKLVPIAGTGKAGKGAVGSAALETALDQPHGIFVAGDGSLYISDSWNGRVLRMTP